MLLIHTKTGVEKTQIHVICDFSLLRVCALNALHVLHIMSLSGIEGKYREYGFSLRGIFRGGGFSKGSIR
jgi:hypothetical protein